MKNANVGSLKPEDGEGQFRFVWRGRGVDEDDVRSACDLADRRKHKTEITDATLGEDALEGLASLFRSDD